MSRFIFRGLKGFALRVVARTWGVVLAGAAVACWLRWRAGICPPLDAIAAYKPAAGCASPGIDGYAESACNCHYAHSFSSFVNRAPLNTGSGFCFGGSIMLARIAFQLARVFGTHGPASLSW